MRIRISIVLAAALLFVSVAEAKTKRSRTTLYDRVGRYDGIAAIVDTYLRKLRADPVFARFNGRGTDTLARARQMFQDQLCSLTGGPCTYPGRDMKTVHGGLGITEAEWAASMRYLGEALDVQKVKGKDRQAFLDIIDGMKDAFVEK